MYWKLLAVPLIIIASFGVASFGYFVPWLDNQLIDQHSQALKREAGRFIPQIREQLASEPLDQVRERLDSMTPDNGFQLSLSPPSGSQEKKANAEPQRSVRTGLAVRRSGPVEHRSLVVNLPIAVDGKTIAVLQATKSIADVDRLVGAIRTTLTFTILAGIGIAILATRIIVRRWNRRTQSLRQAIQELGRNDAVKSEVSQPVATGGRDEMSILVQTVERTLRALHDRIQGIDRVRRDLQSMLETIPEAVIAIDAEQRVLFANPSTYRLFGLPPHDISGQKLWAILRQPGLQDAVSLTFASKDQTSTEFEIRHPPRVLAFRGRSLAVGSGRGIIIVLHDITELRRLERMRQDFFASVSHELKTPLAAIKAYTETLLDSDMRDVGLVDRFLRRIEEQADRLHALVIDMLMLARVESEDHGFEMRLTELGNVVFASAESFREKAEAKGVTLACRLPEAPIMITADAEGLGMIVRNLVDNAVKYTPSGGQVTVDVSTLEGKAVLTVTDTGSGIPAADLTRIFERFYRVDKARSRELGGTGLGLSIVKHLVQRFDGTVSVRSRLNEGSVFTVSLPSAANVGVPTSDPTRLIEQETSPR